MPTRFPAASSSSLARQRRARRLGDAAGRLEPLESRQLLAADLAVGFDDFANVPATLIPGDRLGLPFIISNQGDTAVNGRVTIRFYLSTDTVFDTADPQIAAFENEFIQLSADGFPNSSEEFTANVTLPTVNPGQYFFLVRITPAAAIGDLNQSNNLAASDDDVALKWQFGNFDGRTNANLTLTSADGVAITYGLNGGGFGVVTKDAVNTDRFDVRIENSGASSNFIVTATGGSGPNAGFALIDDVEVTGSLAALDARNARLLGDVTINGTVGFVRFAQVQGPSLIDVRTDGVDADFEFTGAVSNLVITSVAGIKTLKLTSWTDTDTAADRIQADWIGSLTATGAFQPSLNLSGRTGAATLPTVNIAGAVSKGAWRIVGRAGNWTFGSSEANFSASVTLGLSSFTSTRIFRGTLAARNITTITLGGLRNGTILAGALLGADARLGGTGADADQFLAGTLNSIRVNGQVINSIVGAGLDPADGVFKNGNDGVKNGRISSVVVTGTVSNNSRFLAKRFPAPGPFTIRGTAINTATDRRFRLDRPPTVTTIQLDSPAAPTGITVTFTDPEKVRYNSFGDGDLVLIGPGDTMTPLTFNAQVPPPGDGVTIFGNWIITPPGGTWDAADNGNYRIVLVAGSVTDTLNLGVKARNLASFTIAL